ncbi:hypothetical protein J6I39_07090 [bacterium]|nr:hypothetical protein [bacterium]
MEVKRINRNQSFKALNFNNVNVFDRQYIKNDFKELKKLGEKYNIRLTSVYSDVPDFSAIDIDVKPLNKDNLKFRQKIFPPTGRSTFKTGYIYIDETLKPSILDSVNDAIKNLCRKIGNIEE